MKKIFTLLLLAFISANLIAQPTIYATIGSGNWSDMTKWETFTGNATNTPGAQGSGTAAASVPSGTHYVYIRAGHTISMNGANRSCLGMTIENTGKLWANETTARRLQIANGGTGFTAPQNWSVVNNGTIGGPTDGIFFEPGTNAGTITLTGTGVYQIQRIRMPGGLVGGSVSFIIDQNIDLTQSANYALAAVYSGTNVSDNYTMTINSGKTAKTTATDGYFNNNPSTNSGGTYTYNINGTLDLSSSTTTAASISTLGPLVNAPSSITLNVNGTMKLGASFTTTSNGGTNAGALALNIGNNGLVDATNTTNLTISSGYTFKITGNGQFRRTVGATDVLFPIGVSTSYNPVTINNAGVSDVFSVNVKNTIDNAPVQPTKVVNKQWTIDETVAGGSVATVKLGWVTADENAGFNRNGTLVIARWNGTAYEPIPATLSGSGTVADPYVATTTVPVLLFSPFIVANIDALPVSLTNIKAFEKNSGVQVEWSTANEINSDKFLIERSIDGRAFAGVGTVRAKGNSASLTSYSWFDAAPVNGVNFYRIKSVDKDGSFKYSAVLKVNIGKGKIDFTIAPNPIKGNQMNVEFSTLTKGTYTLRLYNNVGQVVFIKDVTTEGGSLTQSFILPSNVRTGIYNLQLAGGDIKINKKVVVE